MLYTRRLRSGEIALFLSIAWFGGSQAQQPNEARDGSTAGYARVRWPLVDYVVHGDSTRGVWIYGSPNLASEQGADPLGGSIDRLRVDPIEARQWAALMEQIMERASSSQADRPIPPVLPGLDGGFMALGAEPHPSESRRWFLEFAEKSKAWSAAATTGEVEALLDTLAAVAAYSAVRPEPLPQGDTVTVLLEDMVERPALLSHPDLVYPAQEQRDGLEGRVWLQFIVDTLGRPESDGILVMLSDSKGFAREALRMIRRTRFRPGRVQGRAVRVLVMLPLNFRLRR